MIEQMELEQALVAREEGQARADANADILWREGVDRAIKELAGRGLPFTADDIRVITGDPPPGFSPNAMGARVSAAAKAGLICQVGYAISTRTVGHGNLVRSWRGA